MNAELRRMSAGIRRGEHHPLGATYDGQGVNFCVFAPRATRLDLVLFDPSKSAPDQFPTWQSFSLDRSRHRSGHYWHAYVPGARPGQHYGYRAHGPSSKRFDGEKLLLDPYACGVFTPPHYVRDAAAAKGDNAATAMRSVVTDLSGYDWDGDHPLNRPIAETVIYEMHVGGFTKHPNSGVDPRRAGTYLGVIDKIPYLKDLGVTAVELLPVFQFDRQHGMKGLPNYWGYTPVSFFAPHTGYASDGDPLTALDEFRDMVRALHGAGLEVILDVVYNHTAEGEADGPTLSWRGLADDVYYAQVDGAYLDYTGTGNTINANHAVVQRQILDSLAFWVRDMHVDGFRFDLASILSRGRGGEPLLQPPIVTAIDSEPALAGTKLIAEAWDAAGLYQVGTFSGERFAEWNGRFRDDVRAFLRGDPGTVQSFSNRLLASPDLYSHKGREPSASINMVTCHDGFTLQDLVSYNCKHNEANREGSRDGSNYNFSWNCGEEGASGIATVIECRRRQVRNFMAINLLSLGTPMLLMGDEVRRSQGGNNNPWCQDNEVSWFDWDLVTTHADMLRYVRLLIELRQRRDIARLDPADTLPAILQRAKLTWHGTKLGAPDWSHDSHSLALEVESLSDTYLLYVAVNAWKLPLRFELPPDRSAPYSSWHRVVDTARESPEDITSVHDAPLVGREHYDVAEHSLIVLIATTPAMFDSERFAQVRP